MAVNKSDLTDVKRASEAYTTEVGVMKVMSKLPIVEDYSFHIGYNFLNRKGEKEFLSMKKL